MRPLGLLIFVSLCAYAENSFMQAFLPRYSTMKQNLIESAEAMPADKYSFKLTPTQRAFGDWIDHTVMLMHNSCAAVKGGAPAPMNHSAHAGDKGKDVLVKALKDAAAGCDAAFLGMTDTQALSPGAAGAGGKPVIPVNAMVGLLTNMATHYGNMVGYLRAQNIVPPSTARSQKK